MEEAIAALFSGSSRESEDRSDRARALLRDSALHKKQFT